MSATLLEEPGKAVSEFEAIFEKSSAGRRDHVGARAADLAAVTVEIMDLVRLLDGLARYRFADDPEPMAAWFSARKVAGPFFRAKVTPPGPGDVSVAPAA